MVRSSLFVCSHSTLLSRTGFNRSKETNMAVELERYRKYGERIEELIRPATFPLAVKIVTSGNEIAPEYKRASRDMGLQNFVCQNFKMSRTYGWTIAVTESDTNCKLARAVYGWDVLSREDKAWAEAFSVGLYAKDAVVASKFEQHLYTLEDDFIGLIISPLSRTKVVPGHCSRILSSRPGHAVCPGVSLHGGRGAGVQRCGKGRLLP